MAGDFFQPNLFVSRRPWRAAAAAVLTCGFFAAVRGQAAPPAPAAPAAPAPAAPSAPAAPDPSALFNTAVGSFDRGDYQGAVSAINDLIKQIPSDLPPADKIKLNLQLEPLYFTLGAAYFNLKQYSSAITALKDYLTRYPHGARVADATFSLGQANFFNKDYDAAAQVFATLENVPALREQALMLEGLSYKENKQDPKAVAAFEKLLANGIRSPASARGAMQLVLLYSQLKEPDKALKMLSTVQANIDQVENVVELNAIALQQGDAYLGAGSNREALACYRVVRTREQVVAIEHDRIAALQKRLEANKAAMRANPREAAQYFLGNKQLQDSIAEDQGLVDAFEKQPAIYPKVLYRIARAFTQMQHPWESIIAYQDSYDRSPDPADREPALFGLITAYADVNQAAVARADCNQYLKDYPQGPNAFTVGFLLGATALQENDPKSAETFFGRMLSEQPGSTLREEMRFLLANAKFAQGNYDGAKAEYSHYLQDFPQGVHAEECVFRTALGELFAGDYDNATPAFVAYLKKYPTGDFASDAKYRLAVCKYAAEKYDEVILDTRSWVKQYSGAAEEGEVQSLLGDALAGTGKPDEALAAYQASVKTATTDEVISYSLTEAGKILQKKGDWAADAAMYQQFADTHPDSPIVVAAISQIGRAKAKEGKADEAKRYLANTLSKYIDDCHRDSVEQILDQLAQLCVRKKPAAVAVDASASASPATSASLGASPSPDASAVAVAAPSPTPEATPALDPGAELDELLGASLKDRSPTAEARILYAKAELAKMRRQPAEADRNLLTIAARFKPDVLSATILGQVGDVLVAHGKPDEAQPFYQFLMDTFPKSDNLDFAYAGLGEIAYQKKQYDKALTLFQEGTDKIAANQKVKDLTVGQAKTLLALGKYPEAKKIFEQAASVREWRGETTAQCVYSLGEVEAKQGHWAEANAYYQRVFVAYQRFAPWVAKAYLGSADSLEKLGKKEDAIKTYQEMLRNPKLNEMDEATEARQRLQALGGTAS